MALNHEQRLEKIEKALVEMAKTLTALQEQVKALENPPDEGGPQS